jgi:hypothetical protein
VPKYEVWWQSTTDHRAVIEAEDFEQARDIGWAAMDEKDIEFEPCETEWDFVSVHLLEDKS